MKRMKRFLISIIIYICICFSYISFANINNIYYRNNIENKDTIIVQIDTIKQLKDSIKYELIKDVSYYIQNKASNINDSIPYYIVKYALEYDIDLCFMMSQTQIETNFGQLGAGREKSRKSLFGVAIKKYDNYNLAVMDYCKLLKRSYLKNGRDEHFLMKNYVNTSGNRYAQDLNYELRLTRTYKFIKNTTNIDELQEKYESIS